MQSIQIGCINMLNHCIQTQHMNTIQVRGYLTNLIKQMGTKDNCWSIKFKPGLFYFKNACRLYMQYLI